MGRAEPLCFLVPLKNILLDEYLISFRKNRSVSTQKPHLCPQSAFVVVSWEATAHLPALLCAVSPENKLCPGSSLALGFTYNALLSGSGAFQQPCK